MELETPAGLQKVSPFGIFCDYGNEFGMATISSNVWVEWTGANRPINASLFLDDVSKVKELVIVCGLLPRTGYPQ